MLHARHGLAFALAAVLAAPPGAPPPGRDVVLPKLLRKKEPNYPSRLRALGIEGQVRLTAVIQVDGTVGEITVDRSDHPEFYRAAVEAVQEWRYSPAKVDGVTVQVFYTVVVRFSLGRASPRVSDEACFGPGGTEEWGPVDVPPRVESRVPVALPPKLSDTGGRVGLEFEICRDGRVRDVRILEASDPDLGAAAAMAARRWTFYPAMRSHAPVAAKHEAELTIRPARKR